VVKDYLDRECTKWDFASYDYKASYLHSSLPRSDVRTSMFFRSSDDEASSLGRRTNLGSLALVQEANRKLTTTVPNHKGFLSSSTTNIPKRVDVILLSRKAKVEYRWSNYLVLGSVRTRQIAALVALNIAVIITLRKDLDRILSNMTSGEVVVKEIYAAQMTVNARSYYFNVRPQLNIQFQLGLQWFSTMLLDAHQNVWDQIEEIQDADYTYFYTEKYLNTWEMMDGEIVRHPRTLVDAVGSFIDAVMDRQSAPVYTATNQSDVTPNIFYLFRNGIGEMKLSMEKARNKYASIEADLLDQAVQSYFLFPVIGLIVLFIFGLSSAAVFLSVMKTGMAISKSLLDNPFSLYLEQKKRVVDRLNIRYEVDLDSGIEKGFRGKRRLLRLTNPLTTSGIAVAGMFAGASLFYFLLYFGLFIPLTTTLQQAPDMVNSYSGLMASLSQAYVWAMEHRYLLNGTKSINYLVPNYLLAVHPAIEENRYLEGMVESINDVMQEYLDGFPLTESHFDFLYRNIANETDYYMQTGMRNCIKALRWDFMFCLSQDTSACTPLMQHIYALQTQLANSSLQYINYFNDDISQAVYKELDSIEGATAAFTVGLVMFLAGYVLCVSRRDYQKARHLWKLAALLPSKNGTLTKITGLAEPSQASRKLLR